MGKTQQRKGRGGELEICRIFQAHGIPAEPGQAVSYGSTPDVTGIPGIHPEVKRVERLNVPEAMAQAVKDSEKFHDGTPVLFHRRNRQEWLCTMRLRDWLGFYEGKKAEIVRKENDNDTEAATSPCGPADVSQQGGGS